jgi:hypothetical protein
VNTSELRKCDRCGKMADAVFPHTCTAQPAIYLAEQIEAVYEAPLLPRKAAAELRRLHAENAELTENLEKKSVAIQRIWKERDELRNDNEALREALESMLTVGQPEGLAELARAALTGEKT